jgi:hypothetical protein
VSFIVDLLPLVEGAVAWFKYEELSSSVVDSEEALRSNLSKSTCLPGWPGDLLPLEFLFAVPKALAGPTPDAIVERE